MNPLTSEQLDLLPREDLLVLVKRLLVEFEALRERVAALEVENEQLKQQLKSPPNSRNSSQPPSGDQKPNQPKNKKRKKHGARFGHQKMMRPLVDKPDRMLQLPVTECVHCAADLRAVAPEDFTRRQILELPEPKAFVLETRQHQTTCPHCLTLNRARLPEGLEAERYFGPNLEATVVFYKQTQHLSYERIVATMSELHGVTLSEGAVAAILQRAGVKAAPLAAAIKEQVRSGTVLRSDETSARVQARNWWQWVLLSENGVYHTIVPTRSAAVIQQMMGNVTAPVWVSDCFSAQLKAPAQSFQLCLAHQLRDLQRVLDAAPRNRWADAVQQLFRAAIHLRHQFLTSDMKLRGYQCRVTQLENQLDRLLEKTLTNAAAHRLQKRFLLHRDKLLTFLSDLAIPPTNNESEQALRGSVIHRKVTYGFRSTWGAQAYAALQTVIATARQKGEPIFQRLTALMGAPILPMLVASTP
jgi:transposase